MRAMRKSLMMRGMVLLHYAVMIVLFVNCWRLSYGCADVDTRDIQGRFELFVKQ